MGVELTCPDRRLCSKPPCRLPRRCWQVDYCWVYGEPEGTVEPEYPAELVWRYNPGSAAAKDAGCLCPVIDNNRGMTAPLGKYGWIMVVGCPMHPAEGSPYPSWRDAEA